MDQLVKYKISAAIWLRLVTKHKKKLMAEMEEVEKAVQKNSFKKD